MRDKIEHSIIALVLLGIGILAGYPEAGMVAGIFLFFGREHAQAVYKLKNAEGVGGMQPKLELKALMFWKWKKDGQLDFYFPAAASIIGYSIAVHFLIK